MDADPNRSGREWKSVDANRSVRRAGEGFVPDRVRNNGVDACTGEVWQSLFRRGQNVLNPVLMADYL